LRSRCKIRCLCKYLTVSDSCRRRLVRSESCVVGQLLVYIKGLSLDLKSLVLALPGDMDASSSGLNKGWRESSSSSLFSFLRTVCRKRLLCRWLEKENEFDFEFESSRDDEAVKERRWKLLLLLLFFSSAAAAAAAFIDATCAIARCSSA